MPSADQHDGQGRRKSSYSEIYTAVVLTLTLLVVAVYTYYAREQARLTYESLRPFLHAGFNLQTPMAGEPLRASVFVENVGNTPTAATITGRVLYTLQPITDLIEPDRPVGRQQIFPNAARPTRFELDGTEDVTAGQISDMTAGIGLVYAVALVEYSGYTTRICTKIEINGLSPDGGMRIDPETCEHPDADFVN